MRIVTLFIFISFLVLCCSWVMNKPLPVNANSWSVAIGKHILLASWKNNKMGDTFIFKKAYFKTADTLYVSQFLCGYFGQNSTVTLTIENEAGELVTKYANQDNQQKFTGKLPLSALLISNRFGGDKIFRLYCSINSAAEPINQSVLMARFSME